MKTEEEKEKGILEEEEEISGVVMRLIGIDWKTQFMFGQLNKNWPKTRTIL